MRFNYIIAVVLCLAALTGFNGASAADEAPLVPIHLHQVRLGGFWKQQVKLLTEKWIPHCIRQMEKGGRGEEFLNLIMTGQALRSEPHGKYKGAPWSDAYPYNTVEAACLALEVDPEGDADLAKAQTALRAKIDEWIPTILAAQQPDGYIHSFHTVNGHPHYSDINWHEFYVMGYFLEMGIAHYRATGGKDRRLYDAAVKCGNHLCATFGPAPKRTWKNGHPGMELALCRLGVLANEIDGAGKGDQYIALAKHFLDHQHEIKPSEYNQSEMPAINMSEALGHAVRAPYFYSAMTDMALLKGDDAYGKAVDRIWSNAIDRKGYITGGAGASHKGEAFARDYELPHNGYCESCAACGMGFWADRMFRLHADARFLDAQERAWYNAILGAVELSGENFTYQNPLATSSKRYPWHGCPCCVGNIPRALIAIKDLMYVTSRDRKTLYLAHFVDSEATLADIAGTSLRIRQETRYPWEGVVAVTLHPAATTEFTLKIRVPNRTESALYTALPDLTGKFSVRLNGEVRTLATEKGFIAITHAWKDGDRVELALPMDVQRIHCDERVVACRGRVALQRGPLVYNFEDVDHGKTVRSLVLKPDAALTAAFKPDLLNGVVMITGDGFTAIPNYARLNRGGWSQVWMVENHENAGIQEFSASASFARDGMDPNVLGQPNAESKFDFWPHKGTAEWVEYDFGKARTVASVKVRWFDDTGKGECRVPASWRIIYRAAGGKWEAVAGVAAYPTNRDVPVTVSFTPVTTTALRLEIQCPPDFSSGLWEWEVPPADR